MTTKQIKIKDVRCPEKGTLHGILTPDSNEFVVKNAHGNLLMCSPVGPEWRDEQTNYPQRSVVRFQLDADDLTCLEMGEALQMGNYILKF